MTHDQSTLPKQLDTFATAQAGRGHWMVASLFCALAAASTLALLPVATRSLPPVPGFLALNQAALVLLNGLTTWVFFAQYRTSKALSLLVLGCGALFTTLIVLLQLVCFPNMLASGLILGQGAATLTWLWSFWHFGPPFFALVYAFVAPLDSAPGKPSAGLAWTATGVVATGVFFLGLLATRQIQNLPNVLDPDGGYWALTTSGIGPAICLLTIVALGVLCWTTRLRSILQVWLAVSLFLMLMDNVITDVGAGRATVGWYAGRIEALLAGFGILGIYLMELNALYRQAAKAVVARDLALNDARATRDNLEVALEASGMGDWEIDLATHRSRRTLRHDRIFGYAEVQDHWDTDRFIAHVLPEDRDFVMKALVAAPDGKAFNVECRIKRADNGAIRWIGIWGKTYTDLSGTPISMAGCVVDATERRLNEERLREAERMEAIGQLTGGVAHDFNNLLTVILGSLDMIKRRPEDSERVRRLAQNAFSAGQRGTELTEKLLSFSRRQVVNPKTVNLNRLLGDFRPLLARAVGETIKISLDLDAQLDPARVDVGQFQAAILNLAGNARDAMPDGGTLALRTRNITLPGIEHDPIDAEPGDYVQVSVADTGAGMDEATAARAFEPFFTTKDVGRGTGLGLSQVYGFARQAGGRCRVKATPGQGCLIELYLPRSRDDAETQEVPTNIVPIRRARGQEVVLIVEDEDTVREMAAESLETLGYGVLTAPDARMALDILSGSSRIDILFSDIVMPGGMNGAQLALQARVLRPTLKVLLTSGYTATATGGARELPPDVPLLRKPYLREELATTLETVLKVGAPMPLASGENIAAEQPSNIDVRLVR